MEVVNYEARNTIDYIPIDKTFKNTQLLLEMHVSPVFWYV